MGKRGPQPKGKVKIKWSANFAYAIGLIATDGNLSREGSRITLVSKDIEQIHNFNKCLNINIKIGIHNSGSTKDRSRRVQFKDVLFFNFLNSIGIFPAKSKTIEIVKIPDKYFFDYVRGCFDGDGTIYSYWDKRWKSSFMFYVCISSASKYHLLWLQNEIFRRLGISGHITNDKNDSCMQLKYAKSDSLKILRKMYKKKNSISLSRKRLKINKILDIVGERKL